MFIKNKKNNIIIPPDPFGIDIQRIRMEHFLAEDICRGEIPCTAAVGGETQRRDRIVARARERQDGNCQANGQGRQGDEREISQAKSIVRGKRKVKSFRDYKCYAECEGHHPVFQRSRCHSLGGWSDSWPDRKCHENILLEGRSNLSDLMLPPTWQATLTRV